jgi:hypothetical protein
MNINISDEMIETMIREQVKARVNQYVTERTRIHPFWLTDMFKNCVVDEVRNICTDETVQGFCKELSKDGIAERVVDKFAEKIASCFEY